jgi:hypothetical protein
MVWARFASSSVAAMIKYLIWSLEQDDKKIMIKTFERER